MRTNAALIAFNRGIVSKLALAREDVDRVQFSAEEMENWVPRTLGSMMVRPALTHIGAIVAPSYFAPFVFSTDQKSLLEFSAGSLRVWTDGEVVSREAVTATVTNGGFDTDLSGWTGADETGASSAWASGSLSLTGSGFNYARQRQTVAVTESGQAHAFRVVIERGPVEIRFGTSAGDDSLLKATLRTGTHSLVVVPTSTIHIELSSQLARAVLVDSIEVEGAGEVVLTTPYSQSDTRHLRFAQSADVVYLSCQGCPQKVVERRDNGSWSFVDYLPEDGPFDLINASSITLTPSNTSGNILLTASSPLFTDKHVGALFRLESSSQTVTATLSGEDQFTDPVRVTGLEQTRRYFYTITGNAAGSGVTLQRSIGEPGNWEDVKTFTNNQDDNNDDDRSGEITFYRLGIKAGDYVSPDNIQATLFFPGGSIAGTVRVTNRISNVLANAEVLSNLGDDGATSDWYEGLWSEERGYPSSVALAEGRLWWFGKNRIVGSVSDDFESFDIDFEGDAGPINRIIGRGPVDNIHWALSLDRILIGTAGSEISLRSSAIDEPLTPTAFRFTDISTQGSAEIDAIQVDREGFFVQRSGTRLYYISAQPGLGEYEVADMTLLQPEILEPGVVRLAAQRQPDTRVHCILSDGTARVLVFDKNESIRGWYVIRSEAQIEDVVVLPGDLEDEVYYILNLDGSRYLTRWEQEPYARGAADTRMGDLGVSATLTAQNTVSGLDHLDGKDVVAWANGKPVAATTVASGITTLAEVATGPVYVGLPYTAKWKSAKLLFAAELTALTQPKKINHLGLLMADSHAQGLRFGRSFDELDDMPRISDDHEFIGDDVIWDQYDQRAIDFEGEWDTDARLCLEGRAPYPCTLLGVVIGVSTNERV